MGMGLAGGSEGAPGSGNGAGGVALRAAVVRRLRAFGLSSSACRAPALQPPQPPSSSSARLHQLTSGAVFGSQVTCVAQQAVKCCGEYIQIPTIVYETCTLLKSHLFIEGLFRKAGSQNRQKDIKRAIDSGGKIDKSYHAVDVASILKLYLRTLPDPLINNDMQEILLRCLLLPESDRRCAIQFALLLLPVSYLHILHYVMEFFKCVALKSDLNKMDVNNLAIVMAPTLMPPPLSCTQQRMDHHVKLVKIFIENSSMIGRIPEDFCLDNDSKEVQKKKKRRSGSLTRMLTGLRKMVTNSTSSSSKSTNQDVLATPVLDKGQNKRKQQETLGFSAKKKKEIIDSLPLKTLASTPIRATVNKEHKKLRLSIGRKAKEKPTKSNPPANRDCKDNQYYNMLNKIEKSNQEFALKSCMSTDLMEIDLSDSKDKDYVRISKSEYEAIKNRVSAIENRISQEFNVITAIDSTEPVQQVQTAYEKTLEEAAMLSSPGSDQIARRLSRELKIRHSAEHKIIRSPSARKIGTIRRRSRENTTKLIRTQTWTASSQTGLQQQHSNNDKANQFYTSISLRRGRPNTIQTGLLQPNPTVLNSTEKRDLEVRRRGSFNDSMTMRSPSVGNDKIVVNPSQLITNRSKRPSSFHGHIEADKARHRSVEMSKNFNLNNDNHKWKSARSVLENAEISDNPLTGRASVAKLRSQMAGMVMAKARLFDGMTDSDSSLEKKIDPKPVRRASVFARKSRRHTSPDKQIPQRSNSSDECSPSIETKLFKKAPYKSPGYVSKRHKSKITRSPLMSKKSKENLNLSSQLKEVIYDICTPLSEKVNIDNYQTPMQKLKEGLRNNGTFKSPRSTPHMKKSLSAKPVAGVKASQNNTVDSRKINTPLRANHMTPRRQSPRLLSMKARQLV